MDARSCRLPELGRTVRFYGTVYATCCCGHHPVKEGLVIGTEYNAHGRDMLVNAVVRVCRGDAAEVRVRWSQVAV